MRPALERKQGETGSGIDGELLAQGIDLCPNLIGAALKVPGDAAHPLSDLDHLRLLEAAGGDSGSAHPDAADDEGLLRIVGNGILVNGDLDLVQHQVLEVKEV